MSGFFNNPAGGSAPTVVNIVPTNAIVNDAVGSWFSKFVIPANSLADTLGIVSGACYTVVTYTGLLTSVIPMIGVYNTALGAATAVTAFGINHQLSNLANQNLGFGFTFRSVSSALFLDAVVGCGGATSSTLGNAGFISQAMAGIDLTASITVELGVGAASSVLINSTAAFLTNNVYMSPKA